MENREFTNQSSPELGESVAAKDRAERPLGYPERFPVPEEKIDWDIDFPEYQPSYFVAQ